MLLTAVAWMTTGCGDSNAIPEEEKAEVKQMETTVVELDSAASETEAKKTEAKAAVDDLLKEFNQ